MLLHVPPLVVSLNVVVLPVQTVPVPVIEDGADGVVFTVTTVATPALPQLLLTV